MTTHTPQSDAAPPSLAERLALPALLLGAAGIGFAPIFVRLSEAGPEATGFWRITLALPALWLWSFWETRSAARTHRAPPRRPVSWRQRWHLLIPGLFFAGDLGVWHISLTMTSVANATLLPNFAPVFVTLFAWLLFRETVTGKFIGGMVLALLGAVTLMAESLTISADQVMGDGLALLTATFYAGYILSVGRLRATYSTATIMLWSALSNAVALLGLVLLTGESLWGYSLYGWMVLLGLALVSHTGGQSLIAYALAHLPASFGSVSLLLQPAVAAVLAWALLGEPLSVWQGVGGVIILGGILLARLGSKS